MKLGYVFFAGLNQSPTDRPEHFAHVDAAVTLEGVSLAAESLAAEAQMFTALGLKAAPCRDDAAATSACVPLAGRQWIHLSSTPSRRRIAGLTVTVRSLSAAVERLDREKIEFRRMKGTD